MATKKKRAPAKKTPRPSRRGPAGRQAPAGRPAPSYKSPPQTVTIECALLHKAVDVLAQIIRCGDEFPRLDSYGRPVWPDPEDCSYDLDDMFDLECRFKEILAKVERDHAVALAVAEAIVALKGNTSDVEDIDTQTAVVKTVVSGGMKPAELVRLFGDKAGGR